MVEVKLECTGVLWCKTCYSNQKAESNPTEAWRETGNKDPISCPVCFSTDILVETEEGYREP